MRKVVSRLRIILLSIFFPLLLLSVGFVETALNEWNPTCFFIGMGLLVATAMDYAIVYVTSINLK